MDTSATVPRWRRISFYVLAGLLLAMILLLLFPLLMFVVLAWLPIETWQTVFPGEDIVAGDAAHRIHELISALVFWGLAIAVGMQLWKPVRRQALMLQAVAIAAAFLVIGLVTNSLEADAIPIIAGIALLAFLHPARESLFRFRKPDRVASWLAVAPVVPGVFFILDHIDLQRLDIAGDEHAEFGHWATMAVFATLIVLWGLIGSTNRSGWQVPALLTAVTAAVFGVASLVFPSVASATSTGWAVAAIVWGGVYAAATLRRIQSPAPRPAAVTAPRLSVGSGTP